MTSELVDSVRFYDVKKEFLFSDMGIEGDAVLGWLYINVSHYWIG